MKQLIVSAGLISLALTAAVANAAGDPEAGEKKAERCAACHGSDGVGIAEAFPNLAGQKEGYLVKTMKDFKSGKRKDPIMELEAKKLSEEDIEDIAAFYSSLSGEELPVPDYHGTLNRDGEGKGKDAKH